jgi:hypothetical protein
MEIRLKMQIGKWYPGYVFPVSLPIAQTLSTHVI